MGLTDILVLMAAVAALKDALPFPRPWRRSTAASCVRGVRRSVPFHLTGVASSHAGSGIESRIARDRGRASCRGFPATGECLTFINLLSGRPFPLSLLLSVFFSSSFVEQKTRAKFSVVGSNSYKLVGFNVREP